MNTITVKDVAKVAGVSPATVSNAISGRSNLSDATREKILQVCKELGYEGMTEKTFNIRDDSSKTMLFCFSEFGRPYYMKIIAGIHDCLTTHGYGVMIYTGTAGARYMTKSFTSGAICLDSTWEEALLVKKARKNYPILSLGRTIESPYIKSGAINNYDAMYSLIKKRVDNGYQKFAFLAGNNTEDTSERFSAFQEVLKEYDLPFTQDNYYQGDYSEKSGNKTAKVISLSKNKPEILVCANDNMAIGALKAFRKAGINVPEEIAVTGFDGLELAEIMELTTVEIPYYECGYLAAQQLIMLTNGQGDFSPIRIDAKVKVRNTTKKLINK